MSTNKTVKNEKWYVKDLVAKVNDGKVSKPKWNRKRKWDLMEEKENVPSEQNYINFLYRTKNSVHAIIFGLLDGELSNIDGNNRINTITRFCSQPFRVWPEKLEDAFQNYKIEINKRNYTDEEKAFKIGSCNKIKEIIKKISYSDLMDFRYNNYFNDNGHTESYDSEFQILRDDMEKFVFDKLIKEMKINGKERFDTDVIININLFEGYTENELNEVFSEINQYNTRFTAQEHLASELYDITNFVIEDRTLEFELKNSLETFYNDKNEDEVLECQSFNREDPLNAYEFIVGFQYQSFNRCSLIEKPDSTSGQCLYFKLYKTIFRDTINKEGLTGSFTSENVNKFVEYLSKPINKLIELQSTIFMENLVGSIDETKKSDVFDTCNKKLRSLKKNNLYLLLSAIIGYYMPNNNNKYTEKEISKSIEKSITFHFFISSIENEEDRKRFSSFDKIMFDGGLAKLDKESKEYLKNPNLISEKITKDVMREVLTLLISKNDKKKVYETYSSGKSKNDKRRPRKVFEKFLIYYYFKNKVPTAFLKHIYWIEHIIVFSSSWEKEIDIDRLGNIVPIISELNKVRSNKHINEYYSKKHNIKNAANFINCIDNIPSVEKYDEIVSHDQKKPHIKSTEKFNEICSLNEDRYINIFLDDLFE